MQPLAIDVRDVTLELKEERGRPGASGMGEGNVGGRIVEEGSGRRVFALDAVSFSVRRGETLAIVGRNGSGKSTLLRVMAGIYAPTRGQCVTQGRITTLFTNQIGVNQNASGLENIRLMCLLLGVPRRRVPALIQEVADFSELGAYLDMPIRTYSAGMKARLGFGLATSLDPDILLIDEVFGTGDQAFRVRARERMAELFGRAGTVMMASHSMDVLREFCSNAIWLDRGRLRAFGPIEDVARDYAAGVKETAQASREAELSLVSKAL